jgi:hypothetical protein
LPLGTSPGADRGNDNPVEGNDTMKKTTKTNEATPDKKCEATFEGLALVKWCAEDIQTLRPDWDAAKCNEFLYEN